MKRALVGGIALVSLLGLSAGATAQEPPPPSEPGQVIGRYQQRTVPAGTKVTGNFNTRNPEKMVAATVVLEGESVLAAQARAERLNQRFDQAAARARITAQQTSITPSLRAAGATPRSNIQRVLNAITVRVKVKDIAALGAVPGVAQVHVSYQLERFNGASDVYTGVPTVWDDLGYTGAGLTIGVIDDGIDYYHATFGGSGDPADWENDDGTAIESGTFPTAKVTGGYDFVGDAYDANEEALSTPEPDDDPLACGEHGTHVSGTAAGQGVLADGSTFTGPYNATTIDDNEFIVAPGSAPEAFINMYKVFGCEGSVNDDVLLDAIESAVDDGVDVINMSLGSSWGTADEPLALAIDAATEAGVLVVVSAGNSGPAAYLVGGPSTANTALSVAATDTSSSTLPAVAITGDITLSMQNSNLWDYAASGPITGELVDVGLGCDLVDYASAAGKIAVATRGVCDRVARAVNGAEAGALAVVFLNNADTFPPVEGVIPDGNVPFVGVPSGFADEFVDGVTITLDAAEPIANPAFTNFADFTSNGPRQDSAPKPDISAPGVNILSALVGSGTEGELLSGTSMAAPHTAGIAILVRQAHPTWGPKAVKAALMSTADASGVGDFNVVRGGAGMVSAVDAVDTRTFLTTADGRHNLAFGFRQLTGEYVASRAVTINNTTGAAITYDISADLNDLDLGIDLDVTFSSNTITVPANSARNLAVSLRINDPENLPEAGYDAFGDLQALMGLVTATPRSSGAGIHPLVAPLVLVPYGLSDIRSVGVSNATLPTAPDRTVRSIKANNTGVHYGSYDTYQWIGTDADGDAGDGVPDLRDIGVQVLDGGLVVVAISTQDRITTQSTGEYDVWIDVDGGGDDYVLVGIDNGLFTAGDPDGVFAAFLLDVNAGFTIVDAWDSFAPANGAVVQLPFLLSSMDLCNCPSTAWSFYVETYSVVADQMPDYTENSAFFDPYAQAVSSGHYDYIEPGDSVSFDVEVDMLAAIDQRALGWMVVSVDDLGGPREADRVPLRARRGGRTVT